jgi:hypothetical protein
MQLRLQSVTAEVANQYLNTNDTCWLETTALKMLLLLSPVLLRRATIQWDGFES